MLGFFNLPIKGSILLVLIFLVPNLSLAQPENDGEIPVTTVSEEARATFLEARDAQDMGRFEDARELLDEAIEKDPNFALAYLYKALSANSPAEWSTNIDKAVAKKSYVSKGEQLMIDIDVTYLRNDADKRFELSKQLAAEYPSSKRALLVLANQHQERNEHMKARDIIYDALQIDADFPVAHRDLAFSYLFGEPKEFSLAEKHMKKFTELRPNEASAYIGLGDVYRAQLRLEKARNAYARATEADPKSHIGFGKKGHANTFLGNYEEARDDYRKAGDIAKDFWKAEWANYANYTYLYAGDIRSALDANERLLQNIENMGIMEKQLPLAKANAYYDRAKMAMHYGEYATAEKALKEHAVHWLLFAKDMNSPEYERTQKAEIVLREGTLAAYQGNYESALSKAKENRKLLEPIKNPRKLEDFHRLMGKIHLLQKHYQEAINHYKEADLNSEAVKYELALAHEGAGNNQEANKLFREVAEWNFNGIDYALIRNEAIEKMKVMVKK